MGRARRNRRHRRGKFVRRMDQAIANRAQHRAIGTPGAATRNARRIAAIVTAA